MRKPIALVAAHPEKFFPFMFLGGLYMFAVAGFISPLLMLLCMPVFLLMIGVMFAVSAIETSGNDLNFESDSNGDRVIADGQVNIKLGNYIYIALPLLLIGGIILLNPVAILLVPVVWVILAALVVVVNTVLIRSDQKNQKAIQADGSSIEMTRLHDRRPASELGISQKPDMALGNANDQEKNGEKSEGKGAGLSKDN